MWLNEETHSFVDSFTKASLPDPMQRRCDSVRPQELVNVEPSFGLVVFISYLVFNHEHLWSREWITSWVSLEQPHKTW
jgi:hypothetical protein